MNESYADDDRTYGNWAVLHTCPIEECLGATVGIYHGYTGNIHYFYHFPEWHRHEVSEEVPDRPRLLLQEAIDTRSFPTVSAPAAVRAVEAMMAEKGYWDRKMGLKGRIKAAVKQGDLPQVMADWANEVRVIGNDTHTDEAPADLPNQDDAERAIHFANMLAEYLFVLPAQISRGRGATEGK